MENSTLIVNTNYVKYDDGISTTLLFLFPFPAIGSLMLCCCFIGIAKSNKPLSAQSCCKYDNGISTVSGLTKMRDLKDNVQAVFVMGVPLLLW